MAITVYTPQDFALGIKQQATFGTEIADSIAFETLLMENAKIEPDIKFRPYAGSRMARFVDVSDLYADQKGAKPKLSLSLLMARKANLPLLLYMFFQKVTEADGTPFGKTFIPHATQPDFSANAGCFSSIIVKGPIASKSRKINDCICTKLVLKCDPGGVLSLTADILGRGAVTLTANPSGTWTYGANSFYAFEDMARATLNFGGAITCVAGGWELELNREFFEVGQSSGNFATWGMGKFTGTLKGSLLYDTAVDALEAALVARTAGTINYAWGNASAGTVDGDLDVTAYGVLKKVDFNHSDKTMLDYELELAGVAPTTTQPITIIMADAVEKTW